MVYILVILNNHFMEYLETHDTYLLFMFGPVSNSQGRNLGRSVTSARTSGLSSIQGDLGERAVKVSY